MKRILGVITVGLYLFSCFSLVNSQCTHDHHVHETEVSSWETHDHNHNHDYHHEHDHDHDQHSHSEVHTHEDDLDYQSSVASSKEETHNVLRHPEELAEELELIEHGFYGEHEPDVPELLLHGLTLSELWIRAMGSSLIVSFASLICLSILPFIIDHGGTPSSEVVDGLAAFGVGAMLGDAFLHQLPHAFAGSGHSHDHDHDSHGSSHSHTFGQLSVGLSVLFGVLLFFIVEKIVRAVEANPSFRGHGHSHSHFHGKIEDKSKEEERELTQGKPVTESEKIGDKEEEVKNAVGDKEEKGEKEEEIQEKEKVETENLEVENEEKIREDDKKIEKIEKIEEIEKIEKVEDVLKEVKENSGEDVEEEKENEENTKETEGGNNDSKKTDEVKESDEEKNSEVDDGWEKFPDEIKIEEIEGENKEIKEETGIRRRKKVTEISEPEIESVEEEKCDDLEKEKKEIKLKKNLGENHSFPVMGYLNLFSDGVHNFTDGMALGAAFLSHGSVGGFSRLLFMLAHELPQEVGDFGILVRSGFSVFNALALNFLSALMALAGTALALVMRKSQVSSSIIEGFTAGGFIYICVAGVMPEMHSGIMI